jgi:hypothetical protein
MNSINKSGYMRNVLWGAFALARTLYNMAPWQKGAKRTVLVEDVVTDIATDTIAKQGEAAKALVSLKERVTSPAEPLLLEPTKLYGEAEESTESPSRNVWGWPLGIGAASATIPFFTGGAATAETQGVGTSAFGYAWSYLPTPLQVGMAVFGIIGILYTANKVREKWNQYWGNPNLASPINNTNTNTLTNTMHINLQLAPGMKLVETINEKGQKVIEIQIEEMQKRAAAAAA